MNVPVNDEDPLQPVTRARVVRSERNGAEQAEAHCAVPQCVMSGRAHGAEAPQMHAGRREIDRVERASDRGAGCVP